MTDKLSDAWQCQSCGCYFPHIPKILDNDVKRCSKCVQVEVLEQRVDGLEGGLGQIVEWSKAYPLDVFPEPDFKKAAELLKAGGMTLDAISASNMRHVVKGVGKIAQEALAAEEEA